MTIRGSFRLCVVLIVIALGFPAMSFAMGRLSPETMRRAVEEKAPDFVLQDLQGRTFRLSEQRGKPVLIVFSATWCPSCREEIPRLKAIHAAYASKGLELVSVDIQEKKEKVTPFAAAFKLPYRTLLDTAGYVAEAYEVRGIPDLILVDRNGIIVCKQCTSLDGFLKKLFAKP